MSPIEREFILYLEDMVQSMGRIEEYLGDINFKQFKINQMTVDAVIRNFEIIGEASKNIPTNIKLKYPEIPWKNMYGLRNLITHEYFGIDYEMIWKIAKSNLPDNQLELKRILKIEKEKDGSI